MITSKALFVGNFGCGSTGIPLPLSLINTEKSDLSSISILFAKPATASSIELSNISDTR